MNFEIGVIPREAIPARSAPLSVAETEAFASAVAQRYAPEAATVSRADLALAWETPVEANYYYDSHSIYYGSPRIEVFPHVTVDERHLSASSRGLTDTPAAGGRRPVETEANVLFERIFARQKRIAAFDSQKEAIQSHSLVSSEQRRIENPLRSVSVERILSRAAVEGPRFTEPSSRLPITSHPGWGTPLTKPEVRKPLTLPASEMKRVADHVIREIDHRITARRERMGKR